MATLNGKIAWITVQYTGEQWRLGAADANIDRLDFQYSTDATSLTSGTYVNVDQLDFVSPNNTTVGALIVLFVWNRLVAHHLIRDPGNPSGPSPRRWP